MKNKLLHLVKGCIEVFLEGRPCTTPKFKSYHFKSSFVRSLNFS